MLALLTAFALVVITPPLEWWWEDGDEIKWPPQKEEIFKGE